MVAWAVLGLALWLTISAYAAVVASGGGPYQTADWLISYAGGFVRRGLFGAIYLAVFPPGQAGLWVLFALQVLLYAIPIAYAVLWLTRSKYTWLGVALVCGPAAFAFVGWDTNGFVRRLGGGLDWSRVRPRRRGDGHRRSRTHRALSRHLSDTGAMVCSALQGKGLSSRLCGGPFGGAIG